MAKAKFMNGEFSAKFKGKRRFVAEQMEAIKDYAARDDMQINICPVIQERPSGKKNTEEQITPTHFISGNLEHAVVAIYDNAGIPSFMHRFRKESRGRRDMKTGKYTKDGREMQVGDVVHFRCKNHPLSGKGVVFMGKEVDGLGEDPFRIRDTRTGRNNGRIYPYYDDAVYRIDGREGE